METLDQTRTTPRAWWLFYLFQIFLVHLLSRLFSQAQLIFLLTAAESAGWLRRKENVAKANLLRKLIKCLINLYFILLINFSSTVELNCKCQQVLSLLWFHSFQICFHFVGSIRVTMYITSKCAGIPLSLFPDLFSFLSCMAGEWGAGRQYTLKAGSTKQLIFPTLPLADVGRWSYCSQSAATKLAKNLRSTRKINFQQVNYSHWHLSHIE